MTSRNTEVVRGQKFKLLSYLESHTLISLSALKAAYAGEFPEDSQFDRLLSQILEDGLCAKIGSESVKLTQEGRSWVKENNDLGFVPEDEDTSSQTGPKNPYVVSMPYIA